ncbi:MAG: hypothetical protein FD167_584 [bacterium]|nr:MAG: hypothetical protein FD167_584 [bacterium]
MKSTKLIKSVKSVKSSKLINRIKGWSAIICLAITVMSVACGGGETPAPCTFCGFGAGEQVQDVGEGGGLYSADNGGCVTIENSSGGRCGRFHVQPLIGNQS